ncbi:unnamed protein product [Effrenium voratum]|uniref:Uncharacterized protein n=1 Tax=Effrenium voratum TaxID=2562239 RepID=A0AA36IAJ1_9DINO|nr:unnamed protein product [Effrenium voratum]
MTENWAILRWRRDTESRSSAVRLRSFETGLSATSNDDVGFGGNCCGGASPRRRWVSSWPAWCRNSWQLQTYCVGWQLLQQHLRSFGKASIQLYHLRDLKPDLSTTAAEAVAASVYWPTVESLIMDMGKHTWSRLLQALGQQSQANSAQLRRLQSVAISFPAERSVASLQLWHQHAAPQLSLLSKLLVQAPLQELVLVDLRSTEVLTAIFAGPCTHLRICRASFIGPESRKEPLTLPFGPNLECLMLRYRDFREQRASRQERMQVLAAPLLRCLKSLREPTKLRVLALNGIRIDGSAQETAALLEGLQALQNLVTVALRFSVPSSFSATIPLSALLKLRQSWPLVSYLAVGDQSLHGFDYWPCEMTDFHQLYPEGTPDARRVFSTEFRSVLRQYKTTPEEIWCRLNSQQRAFWEEVAGRLPLMPQSEIRLRVAQLFPGPGDENKR